MTGPGVGVIGLGFMGRTHVRAYAAANDAGRPNRLVCVCDREPERFTRSGARGNLESREEGPLFDPDETAVVTDPDELLAREDVDVVSICTPTDSHVELARRALAAGKHVLVEKPVALTSAEVERLAAASRDADTLCMPAMCIRFWPGWSWLADAIRADTYGRVRSATFRRLSARPGWSPEFYRDTKKSGGALFDLHIHDADFVHHLFGPPSSIESTGDEHHVTTLYRYAEGPEHVVAEGGWDHADGFPFHMGYVVVFEGATATYSIERDPPLALTVKGETRPVDDLEPGTGYDHEVRHFLAAVAGETELGATMDEAVELARMLEAERSSLQRR